MNKLIAIAIAIFAIVSVPAVYASGKSPYQSGYSHGRDDCSESPDDRYINEPGKGPSQHTDQFMNGYRAGFSSCGGSSGGNNEDGVASRLCRLVDNNRLAAAALAVALGYPGLDSAVNALCGN